MEAILRTNNNNINCTEYIWWYPMQNPIHRLHGTICTINQLYQRDQYCRQTCCAICRLWECASEDLCNWSIEHIDKMCTTSLNELVKHRTIPHDLLILTICRTMQINSPQTNIIINSWQQNGNLCGWWVSFVQDGHMRITSAVSKT